MKNLFNKQVFSLKYYIFVCIKNIQKLYGIYRGFTPLLVVVL